MSNIKAYQSDGESTLSFFPSPSCCTPGCFFTRWSLMILTISCRVYIHTKCSGSTDGMNWRAHRTVTKERSFMALVGFDCPMTGEKKLLLEKENLDSLLKYLKSCICLKSENVDIENEGVADNFFWTFGILHFKMRKWIENWPPRTKYNPLPPQGVMKMKQWRKMG